MTEYHYSALRVQGFILSIVAHMAILIGLMIVGSSSPRRSLPVRNSFMLVMPLVPKSAKLVFERPRPLIVTVPEVTFPHSTPHVFISSLESIPSPPVADRKDTAPTELIDTPVPTTVVLEHRTPISIAAEPAVLSAKAPVVRASPRVVQPTGFDLAHVPEMSSQSPHVYKQTNDAGFAERNHAHPTLDATGRVFRSSTLFDTVPQSPTVSNSAKTVRENGFAEVTTQASGTVISPRVRSIGIEPIRILQKARPAYTEDARNLQIEGEVVLEATFTAFGEIRVIRILHGLGHGLDENAIVAARTIRFVPAQMEGRSVDQTGTIRLTFQLAY